MNSGDPSPVSGEDRLIADYFRPLARHPGALGLEDDAAVLTPPEGHDLILTKDAVVAGVHFFADDPAQSIGRKALRVNLSDLAAKGARPAGFLLAIALPEELQEAWLQAFTHGLGDDAEAYACPLLGGDTVRSPGPLMISITAFGTVPHGAMVRRRGAQPGDRVFVSGTIGDAALGLRLRRDPALGHRWGIDAAQQDFLLQRYRVPSPRTALADAVRAFASAAMDVSDGLVGDFGKLCRVSAVSADVEIARVPLSAPAQAALAADADLLEPILTGGDDYEILCTVPEAQVSGWLAAAAAADVAVTEIGRIAAGDAPPRFHDGASQPRRFARNAFSHF